MTNYAKNIALTIYQSLVPEIRPNISSIHTFNKFFFLLIHLKKPGLKSKMKIVCRLRDESMTKRRSRDIARGLLGQHSLTSVERPSYLRSDFVNA